MRVEGSSEQEDSPGPGQGPGQRPGPADQRLYGLQVVNKYLDFDFFVYQ